MRLHVQAGALLALLVRPYFWRQAARQRHAVTVTQRQKLLGRIVKDDHRHQQIFAPACGGLDVAYAVSLSVGVNPAMWNAVDPSCNQSSTHGLSP